MRDLIENVKEKTNEIKKILPDLIEYHAADEIESKCNEISDLIVESLWEKFEDVLFVEEENGILVLNSEWNGFDAGTDRETIWRWFNKQHSKGINWLLNGIE